MWAAQEAVGHNGRYHAVDLDKCRHLRRNLWRVAYVAVDDLPIAHLAWFRVLAWNDADHDLSGAAGVGAIKCIVRSRLARRDE